MPSDLLNDWKNGQCVLLNNGKPLKSGSSSTYRLTLGVDETALDANDDFAIRIDDLGSFTGTEGFTNLRGSAFDTVDFDAQA